MAASPRLPIKVADRSHYIITRAWRGWTVTVHRAGETPETEVAETYPEAVRLSRRFARKGMVGMVVEG